MTELMQMYQDLISLERQLCETCSPKKKSDLREYIQELEQEIEDYEEVFEPGDYYGSSLIW